MKGDEFIGFICGYIVMKTPVWFAEENTVEGFMNTLTQRWNEHNDEIQKHVTRMEANQEGPECIKP